MNPYAPIRSFLSAFGSLLYPPGCMHCHVSLDEGEYLCAECADRIHGIRPPFCTTCSQPFGGEILREFDCPNCHRQEFYFDHAICILQNRGLARRLLHQFKYHRAFHLRRPLGGYLCECLQDSRMRHFDAIVPVPLHRARQREREFNQSEALAQVLAENAGVRVFNALRRTRHTTPQVHFQRNKRMKNLLGAFRVHAPQLVDGKDILLVDDIFTTGATVNSCAKALREAGCGSVQVATVARS